MKIDKEAANMPDNNSLTEKLTIRWGIIGCGAVTEIKSAPAYQKTTGLS